MYLLFYLKFIHQFYKIILAYVLCAGHLLQQELATTSTGQTQLAVYFCEQSFIWEIAISLSLYTFCG